MRILDVFYEADADLTLHEISAKAKVGKTSAFRILFTLDSVGYVEKDPASGKYRLGLGIIEAARRTLAGRDLVQVARPHLKKLRDEFDETTNLAALRDDKIVYLEIFESHHSFRMTDTVGSRVPWHSTALGKSIAAFLDQEKLKAVLKQSGRKRFTPHTITGVREYSKELAKVKAQGYSLGQRGIRTGSDLRGFTDILRRQRGGGGAQCFWTYASYPRQAKQDHGRVEGGFGCDFTIREHGSTESLSRGLRAFHLPAAGARWSCSAVIAVQKCCFCNANCS